MNSTTPALSESISFPQRRRLGDQEARVSEAPKPIVLRPKDIIDFARRWFFVIAAVTVVAATFAAVSLVRATPIYISSAQILLGDQGLGNRNNFDLVEAQALSNSVIEGELAILQSTNLLLRVVKRLELENDPEFNPSLRPPPARIPVIDDLRDGLDAIENWVRGLITGQTGAAGSAAVSGAVADASDANAAELGEFQAPVDHLRGAVSVRQMGSSFVIQVTARSTDPRKAAAIANTVMEEYIAFLTDKRFAAAQRFTNWLEGRVSDLAFKWEESANEVLAFQTEIDSGANSSIRLDQQMTEMTSKLVTARAEMASIAARLENLDAKVANDGILAAADLLSTEAIQTFRQDLVSLRREETQLIRSFGADSTQVQAVERAIDRTLENIQTEVVRARAEMGSTVAQQQITVEALQGSLRQLESLALFGLKDQIRLDQLMRVSDANRRVYEEFLGRFKESSEITNLQRSDAEIITYASPPGSPDSPRKKVALALASAGGLLAGVGVAFLLELRRRGRGKTEAFVRQTGLTVFTDMPALPQNITAQRLAQRVETRPGSRIAAAARDLRRNIDLISEQPVRSVVISNTAENSSAASLAMLLAWSYAQAGRKCLLVDADIRTAALTSRIGVKEYSRSTKYDLVSALHGEYDVSSCVVDETSLGVSFLPASRSSADPDIVFSARRSSALFAELIERYEIVVILAPPLSGAAHGFAPRMQFDIALLDVDTRSSDTDGLSESLGNFDQLDVRKRGVVLTG